MNLMKMPDLKNKRIFWMTIPHWILLIYLLAWEKMIIRSKLLKKLSKTKRLLKTNLRLKTMSMKMIPMPNAHGSADQAVEDEPASEDDVDEDDTDAERSWKR